VKPKIGRGWAGIFIYAQTGIPAAETGEGDDAVAFDLVVRNGVVIDGTGAPGFEADVAVEGDKIAAIGKQLGPGKTEIDARGSVVAPASSTLTPTWTCSCCCIPTATRS